MPKQETNFVQKAKVKVNIIPKELFLSNTWNIALLLKQKRNKFVVKRQLITHIAFKNMNNFPPLRMRQEQVLIGAGQFEAIFSRKS